MKIVIDDEHYYRNVHPSDGSTLLVCKDCAISAFSAAATIHNIEFKCTVKRS